MCPRTDFAARGPELDCRVLHLDASAAEAAWTRLHDQLSIALAESRAVVILCITQKPMADSKEDLRQLDERLKPLVAAHGLRVSRSATEGAVAWAACATRPIGVDVQAAPAHLDDTLLGASLTRPERNWLMSQPDAPLAFARLWSAKEAVLKAFGVGLSTPPNEIDAVPAREHWQRVSSPVLGHAWLAHLSDVPATDMALAVALNAGHG